MQRRQFLHTVATATGLSLTAADASASSDLRVGILHSQTGTMALSEKPLVAMALMTLDEINEAGGVLGREVAAVVRDPGSDKDAYAAQARELLAGDKVAAVFGCWTSASRKAVLPVFKEHNGLLFYPVQYEGEEMERNVFYTGPAPNQQALPALNYLSSDAGGAYRRFFLLGSDYVYPRTTNRILRNYLIRARGIPAGEIPEIYTPLGHGDYSETVRRIREFAGRGGKTLVVSTLNGDTNVHFYRALAAAGITAAEVAVLALSVDEAVLAAIEPRPVGHLAAWPYMMSIDTPANRDLIRRFRAWTQSDSAVVTDPMVATHIGIHLWKQAVERQVTSRVDAVITGLAGQRFRSPTDSVVMMDFTNHHLQRPLRIGLIRADGQFDVAWTSPGPFQAIPFNPYFKEAAAPAVPKRTGKA
jgi:urea transport system substrate-binding protein